MNECKMKSNTRKFDGWLMILRWSCRVPVHRADICTASSTPSFEERQTMEKASTESGQKGQSLIQVNFCDDVIVWPKILVERFLILILIFQGAMLKIAFLKTLFVPILTLIFQGAMVEIAFLKTLFVPIFTLIFQGGIHHSNRFWPWFFRVPWWKLHFWRLYSCRFWPWFFRAEYIIRTDFDPDFSGWHGGNCIFEQIVILFYVVLHFAFPNSVIVYLFQRHFIL